MLHLLDPLLTSLQQLQRLEAIGTGKVQCKVLEEGRGVGGWRGEPGRVERVGWRGIERAGRGGKGEVCFQDLSAHDKEVVWHNREKLVKYRRGLLALFHSTCWQRESDVRKVLELVDSWDEVEVDDALELLGSNYSVVPIRALAIRSLDKVTVAAGLGGGEGARRDSIEKEEKMASKQDGWTEEEEEEEEMELIVMIQVTDAELMCFLMPLTVALRYDVVDLGGQEEEEKEGEGRKEEGVGILARFLIKRSLLNASIAMAFYWHLVVERSCGGNFSRMYRRVHALLSRKLQASQMLFQGAGEGGGGREGAPKNARRLRLLEVVRQQEHFVASLSALVAEVRKFGKLSRPQQVERLREAISPAGNLGHLADLAVPVHLPNQSNVV
eukprot:752393-Hanusia_phi.AAC.1